MDWRIALQLAHSTLHTLRPLIPSEAIAGKLAVSCLKRPLKNSRCLRLSCKKHVFSNTVFYSHMYSCSKLLRFLLVVIATGLSPGGMALAKDVCPYCADLGRACQVQSQRCVPCTSSANCSSLQSCNINTGYCDPKSLFHPFLWNDGIMVPLMFISSAVHNAAGTGGGTSYIALFVLVLGFRVATASANSHAFIFAGMIANVLVNLWARHPFRDMPRIDWNLVATSVPLFLAGSSIGVFLNQLFPNYFLSLLLAFLMLLLTMLVVWLGVRLTWREMKRHPLESNRDPCPGDVLAEQDSLTCGPETSKAHTKTAIATDLSMEDKTLLERSRTSTTGSLEASSWTASTAKSMEASTAVASPGESTPIPRLEGGTLPGIWLPRWLDPLLHSRTLDEMMQFERPWFQWRYWLFLASCWSVLFVARYLSGSREARSPVGMPLCGVVFWVVFALQEAFLVIAALVMCLRNIRLRRLRELLGFPRYVDANDMGDFPLHSGFLVPYMSFTFLAGILDTWIGVSGSALLVPYLYVLGRVEPFTVQSSVSAVIFVTSSAGAVQFLVYGKLIISYALFYGLWSLLGSLFGVVLVYYIALRYRMKAIFLLALAAACAFSFGTLVYVGIRNVVHVAAADAGWVFNSICSAASRA
jgi:uncharacterized membrane protein YfcA